MSREIRKNWGKVIIAGIVMTVLFGLRYLLTRQMGLFFVPNAGADDFLLLRYSWVEKHFQDPDTYSLAKTMSFPLLLYFCQISGISYSFLLTFCWGLAALTTALTAYVFTKKFSISVFFYALVLFSPIGLERASARVYRLGILPPMVALLFGLMILSLMFLIRKRERAGIFLILNLLTGFVGLFTAYIKEDGIWVICCLAFFGLVNVIYILFSRIRQKRKVFKTIVFAIIAALPVLIYIGGTGIYRSVNERAFGVSLITNRTEGEISGFINRLYRTDSEDRTDSLWAPPGAVEQVIRVSPTLSGNETITRALRTGSSYDLPIKGDFMGWVLLDAIDELEWDTDYIGVQEWFRKVNEEIDEAFRDGRLKKEDRFQLLSSTGGRTGEELIAVFGDTFRTIGTSLWLDVYYSGDNDIVYDEGNQPWLEEMEKATGDTELFHVNEDGEKREKTHNLINRIFWIYRVLNTLLVVMSLVAFVVLFRKFRKKKERTNENFWLAALMVVVTGILFVYSFGISWFCTFLDRSSIAGYGGAIYSMMVYVFLLGSAALVGRGSFKQESRRFR